MIARECPSPEDLARFADGPSAREWRGVVRHLADCDACRRHVELLRLSNDEPLPRATLPAVYPTLSAPPLRRWQRVAQAVAAAAVIAALAWAVIESRRPTEPIQQQAKKMPPAPVVRPPQAPIAAPTLDAPREPDAPPPTLPPVPQEEKPIAPSPNLKPLPTLPTPSPFLAERARSEVSQELEIAAGDGSVSIVSGGASEPLAKKATVKPSDTLVAAAGGSFSLSDGTRFHLAQDTEVKVAWSQTLACASLDLRKGEAIVDLGAQPKSLHVARGLTGIRLHESSGRLWVASDGEALRATPITGAAGYRTAAGERRQLDLRQSLVLGEQRDLLEDAPETAYAPRFPTLDAVARVPEPPVAAPKRAPAPENVLLLLATHPYAYRVSGRQVREGVWAPAGLCVSTIDEFVAVRRLGDKIPAHVRRGTRPWDDLGSIPLGSREARVLEIVKNALPPHVLLQDLIPAMGAESAVRVEQIGDRQCHIWDRQLDPAAIRATAELLFAAAIAEGRIEKPEFIYWDTLQGALEFAITKTHERLVRVTDRRKVSYSYKTFGGLDRRWYHLETVYEFSEHGQAALRLPADMIRELLPGKK